MCVGKHQKKWPIKKIHKLKITPGCLGTRVSQTRDPQTRQMIVEEFEGPQTRQTTGEDFEGSQTRQTTGEDFEGPSNDIDDRGGF